MGSTLAHIATAIVSFISILLAGPATQNFEKQHLLYAPPKVIKYFTFGYHESVADSLWLRLIQDIDICQDGSSAVKEEGEPRCKTGWSYQLLDLVTEITPKFRMPYVMGATILSVVVDDREGATRIFEKAVKEYPNDWNILYRAAYHSLWEEKNTVKAAELMVRVAQNGGPLWTAALAGRLYTDAGKAHVAKTILEDQIAANPNAPWTDRLKERLRKVNEVLGSSEIK